MNKPIFRSFCMVLFISLLLCSGISIFMLSNQILKTTRRDMLNAVRLVDYNLDYTKDLYTQVAALNPLAYTNNSRLTVIDESGNVLADSDYEVTDNHLARVEVQEALKSGVGYSSRYSDALEGNMLYVAYYNNQHIVRISIPYNGILDHLTNLIVPLTTSLSISLLIAALVASKLAKRLSKPVMEISDAVRKMNQKEELLFERYEYEEYNIVADAIIKQSKIIKETMHYLEEEKDKINNILDQMNEGFILLDEDLHILMVNQRVKLVFDANIELKQSIKNYIFDLKIIEALDNVSELQQTFDIAVDKIIYACYINKIEYGVTLLFVDVTENRNATKMRQEFFSNISHELKTPMTAIKGYSELLQEEMIQDKNMRKKALLKIQKEVDHMATLTNDILMISRLESKDIEVVKHPVMVRVVVDEIIDSITLEANKRDIKIYNICKEVVYHCNQQHMHQLLTNLIVNAVKYNKKYGKVVIDAYQSGNNVCIEVNDTGIGIALVNQNRVFERFYRCDKGRTKSVGGTGLGLAIVKHIVQYYKGTITLISTLRKGTKIKIVLPINSEEK